MRCAPASDAPQGWLQARDGKALMRLHIAARRPAPRHAEGSAAGHTPIPAAASLSPGVGSQRDGQPELEIATCVCIARLGCSGTAGDGC